MKSNKITHVKPTSQSDNLLNLLLLFIKGERVLVNHFCLNNKQMMQFY